MAGSTAYAMTIAPCSGLDPHMRLSWQYALSYVAHAAANSAPARPRREILATVSAPMGPLCVTSSGTTTRREPDVNPRTTSCAAAASCKKLASARGCALPA
eukprot:6582660-Prymnesium_polylepis.1